MQQCTGWDLEGGVRRHEWLAEVLDREPWILVYRTCTKYEWLDRDTCTVICSIPHLGPVLSCSLGALDAELVLRRRLPALVRVKHPARMIPIKSRGGVPSLLGKDG